MPTTREIDSSVGVRKMLENLDNTDMQTPAAILEQQAHIVNFRKQRITHMSGLREIILTRNKLGDQFVHSLEQALAYDKYVKVINLSGNNISSHALKHLVKLALIENNSIVAFDARCNPGCTDKVQRMLALCMLKNIEKMQEKGINLKKDWIRWDLVSVGIPANILNKLGIWHPS